MADDSIQTEKKLHGEGFYKYMTSERCYQVLSSKKIRFNSPLLFNDPFDVVREAAPDIELCEIEKLKVPTVVSSILKNELTVPDDFPNKEFLQNLIDNQKTNPKTENELEGDIISEIDKNKPNFDKTKKKINPMWRQLLERARIFCLSKKISNVPLWYHYADEYRGAVISFKKHEEKVFKHVPRNVEYKDSLTGWSVDFWKEYFNLDINNNMRHELMLETLMKEKNNEWAYEEEVRLINFVHEKMFKGLLYTEYEIKAEDVNAIYLGPFIDYKEKSKIISLVSFNYPDAKIYQATIKNKLEFIEIV